MTPPPRRAVRPRAPLARARRAGRMILAYERPWTAVRNRVAAQPGREVEYRLRGGPRLVLDSGPEDVRIVNEVWLDRVYEPDDRFVARPGWCVVDVGAHKGTYSCRAAWLMGHGTIVAFEPEPRNHAFLVRNVVAGPDLRFLPRHAAVGATDRRAQLVVDSRHSGRHTLYGQARDGDAVDVAVVAAERLLEGLDGRVDLLKIDAEGAEYEILLDSPGTLLARVDRVILEYEPRDPGRPARTVRDLVDHLTDAGFDTQLRPERSLVLGARPAGGRRPS